MKRSILYSMILVALTMLFASGSAFAGPDQYCGDTAMFGGTPTAIQPNVLIIVDDSGSMSDTVPGEAYDPAITYPVSNVCRVGWTWGQPCVSNLVYNSSYTRFLNAGLTVSNVTTACPTAATNPQNLLLTTGQYNGRNLYNTGACRNTANASYLLGNYINWLQTPGLMRPKIAIARDVVTSLINSTSSIRMGLMKFHYPGGVPQGAEFLDVGGYVTTVKDMDDIFSGATTNRQALVTAVSTLTDNGATPLGEALFEALRYFQGGQSAVGNTVGLSGSPSQYTSPIEYACQKNYIIFVTDGMSNSDNIGAMSVINTTYGRWDGGGCANPPYTTCSNVQNHSLAGVAKYMYEQDMRPDAAPGGLAGLQNVVTYMIGFGLGGSNQEAVDLLKLTADQNHGHGNYYLAESASALSTAFTNIISEINSVNQSFLAPVVPASPENRSYSGNRMYMGFFKPSSSKFWSGNLKKFGLATYTNLAGQRYESNIVDASENLATYQYVSEDIQHDYRDNAIVPLGRQNGSFRDTSISYWSVVNDRGEVEEGGAGEMLLNRATPRNIYTFKGSSVYLNAAANAFDTAHISETQLGLTAGDTAGRDRLVNFIHGLDAYDADSDGDTTEKRPWILGDILHSQPQVANYKSYASTQESNCTANNTLIFVGANDGMMHAFRDCDGSEAWAFIPPDLLPNLQYLAATGTAHTYFADFSPAMYVYNKDKTGVIKAADGDKVILTFGLRRGGGVDTAPTQGYYYALDVTDPENPVFLWSISGSQKRIGTTVVATTDFAELAESWGEISFGKIKIGTTSYIAGFMGAGYDNCNEDARYGSTQTFTGSCVLIPTAELGATTSAGAVAQLNPKGRGVYVIEIAQLDSNGLPTIGATSGNMLHHFDALNTTGLTFSIPSRLTPVDTNSDGYIDRLYAGDTGGNMWRFKIFGNTVGAWAGQKIFSSNPGYSAPAGDQLGIPDLSTGRKIFYPPSALVRSSGKVHLYFGTGDREHPLNTAVVDRLYSLIDQGQTTVSAITEAHMVDVTDDMLQGLTTTLAQRQGIINRLLAPTNYGWYIRLNQDPGEKMLSAPLYWDFTVFYTTYSPTALVTTDPCVTGNLGTARMYHVDYLSGNAIINYDKTNDATVTTNPFARPAGATFNLLRSDRVVTLGSGIPSAPVAAGNTILVGAGEGISGQKFGKAKNIWSIYWRQMLE